MYCGHKHTCVNLHQWRHARVVSEFKRDKQTYQLQDTNISHQKCVHLEGRILF